jgi:hypothetical protein
MTATRVEPSGTPRQKTQTQKAPLLRPQGEVSRVIAADATELYHRVTDVTRTPAWSPETRRCDWLDGATSAHVGARFLGHNRVGTLRWSRLCEVVTAEPGREFAFRTVPRREREDSTVWSFRFDPVPDGTRVSHGYEIVRGLSRRDQRIAATLLARHRDRRPDLARSLDLIAAAAEGRAAARQPQLGQAHTAEGPLDLSAMFVMHHAFRRDLNDFALAVPATPLEDTQSWAALQRRWTGFATSLHHHHRVEDLWIWPPLLNRVNAADDAGGRTTLAAMEAEHAHIDPLLETCARGFQAMTTAPDAVTRDRLTDDVARTRDVLTDHLAHEETDALPLAQRHLSTTAWKDSEIAARKEFGLRDLRFTVPWSALGLPSDQFDIAFAHGGSIIRAILALTRRRFEREHRIAFRHLPSG